jgi:ribosome-associated protein
MVVSLRAEEIARLAVRVAAEKQASDIVMLDVRDICSFADYFVICSVDSTRHIEAVWQGVIGEGKKEGIISCHREGDPESGWMLADFGSVVVHIFTQPERDYYQLDRLWDRAIPVIRIQ